MNSRQNASWLCVSMACLVHGSSIARAQDLEAQMHRQSLMMSGPPESKPVGTRPGLVEQHPDALMPGPDAHHHRGELGEHQRDAGMHNRELGEHRDRDASAAHNAHNWGDAGVRHHRGHHALTPEQQVKRTEQLTKLREQYGSDTLRHPNTKAEFTAHAWRIARLERMRSIATDQKKTKLVERIDALIGKENERHQKHLEKLREAQGKAPTTLPASALPATAHSTTSEHTLGGHP